MNVEINSIKQSEDSLPDMNMEIDSNHSKNSLTCKLFNQKSLISILFWVLAYSLNFLYFIYFWLENSVIPLISINIFICIVFIQIFSDPIDPVPDEFSPDEKRKFENKRSQQRYRWMIFAYSFMLFAPLMIFYPLIQTSNIKSLDVHTSELSTQPVAIFVGCSLDNQNKHLSCFKPKLDTEGELQPPPMEGKQQPPPIIGSWVVNIGGAIHHCEHMIGGKTITCQVNEGLLVPLYTIIIALMGGSVSIARRVPELPKQASQEHISTEEQPKITQYEFREQLILQIVQYTVAPFLAILAYYLVEPSNTTNSIALAFMAGFSSETILRMVRSIADKITPKMDVQPQFGSVVGVIRFNDLRPVSKAEVFISNSLRNLLTITDGEGFYMLGDVPIGEHIINVKFIIYINNEEIEVVKKHAVIIERSGAITKRNMVIQVEGLAEPKQTISLL